MTRILDGTLSRVAFTLFAAATVAAVVVLAATAGALGAPRERLAQNSRPVDVDRNGAQIASGELLVAYNPQATIPEAQRANRQRGAKTIEIIPQLNARVLAFPKIKHMDTPRQRLRALQRTKRTYAQDPLVDVVDYNYRHRTSQSSISRTRTGGPFGGPWGLYRIGAPEAWKETTGSGANVAIVDTGIDDSHPDLADKVVAEHDFVDDDKIANDEVGHGTHVAGIAAASANGKTGLGTCPGCGIIVAKIAGSDGVAYDSDVAEGIIWSADQGADAINVSLVSQGYSRVLERAVEYTWSQGSLVVAAAGNDGSETPMFPGAYGAAMSVSAIDETERLLPFSNYGDWIDVAAPGQGIVSTVPGGTYSYLDGTSQATAFVTGTAGLLASQGLSASDIRYRMEFTAEDLGSAGNDPVYGAGRIDAASAVGVTDPKPEISSVQSEVGKPGRWLPFVIRGSEFQNGARVTLVQGQRFMKVSAVDWASSRKLYASTEIPRSAAGKVWNVIVTNPDGQQAGYVGAVKIAPK